MVRNPPVEMIRGVRISAPLFHGRPDHTHPPRKKRWRKLRDIKHDWIFILPGYEEFKFGEVGQTVGPQSLTGLVDETRVVSDLLSG